MGNLFDDLKYGVRMHTKTAGLTMLAVCTLALGIGASTAVFSVVDAILLKPLPYPNADKIVLPWRLAPVGLNLGYSEIPWGLTDFRHMSRELKSFESLGAFKSGSFNLTGVDDPVMLEGFRATFGFFRTLGVSPVLGRAFTPEEDKPGQEHEVILSHQLWQERFHGSPTVLGRFIELNGEPYRVVGVMPAGFAFPHGEEMPGSFEFPRQPQCWVPLALPSAPQPNEPDELAVVGRLTSAVTPAQAQAEMNVLSARMEKEYSQSKGWFNARLTSLTRQVAGDTRTPLLLILGAVGVVLLITCSNVANLLLARSLGRRTEFALRAALGAGKGRLIQQLLVESLLLALAGGVLGSVVAISSLHLVKQFGPANIPRLGEIGLDLRVLAFVLGITLLSGILFGLVPALGATAENPAKSLKEGGRGTSGNVPGPRIRNGILVLQVALALVLVIASSLLVQTFLHILTVDPGFNPTRVLAFELPLPSLKYKQVDQIVHFYQRALQAFEAMPGVSSAGISEVIPMEGATDGSLIRFPGNLSANAKSPFANYSIASPGYFRAIGTPILRGRAFLESDTAKSIPVAIINNAMAKKFWPEQNPIGKQVGLASPDFPLMTIIGIVADVKHLSLREDPGPEMYVPYTQKPYPSMLAMRVVIRTKAEPSSITSTVRQAVRTVDPDLPIAKVTTLSTLVDDSLAGQKFSMLLVTSFGVLALVLACIGMYGVISYSVMQQTREIGIRMALGAERRTVFTMILFQGARLAAVGIVSGTLIALWATRLMSSVLYGVQATNALTFIGVSVLLIAIALIACYVPARRATGVDPMIALRYE